MNILYEYNHLDSTSYLTYSYGMPSHYYNYLPFGVPIAIGKVSQNTTNYNNIYRFSAKELYDETQLSYFGARYYDARLSVSVCDVLGIGTKLICEDYGEGLEDIIVNSAGVITQKVIDKALPGPNPNVSNQIKDLIIVARETTKNTGTEKAEVITDKILGN